MITELSVLATNYVQVSVSASVNGAPYNPTVDPVVFAFMTTGDPGVSDWKTGSWDVAGVNLYLAQCLVGPAGVAVLPVGTYTVWVKVTDNPEIPTEAVGLLSIV